VSLWDETQTKVVSIITDSSTERLATDSKVKGVSTGEWLPAGKLNMAAGAETPLLVDIAGNLKVRSQVLTDEGGFQDSFGGTTLGPTWTVVAGAGTSYSVANGLLVINGGTTANSEIVISRELDYLPIRLYCDALISQRIANQDIYIEFADNAVPASDTQYARYHFNGTNSQIVLCETQAHTGTGGQESATVTTIKTSVEGDFIINMSETSTNFSYGNDVQDLREAVAEFSDKVPDIYAKMWVRFRIKNGAIAPASSTSLSISNVKLANYNRLEIGTMDEGEPVKVKIVKFPTGNLGGYVDDEVTYNIEQSKAFFVTGNFTTLAGNATMSVLITTPAAPVFINIRDMSSNITKSGNADPCLLRFWGDATVSANGSAVTAFNNNRNSAAVATVAVYTGPTITGTGTKLIEYVAHTDWETYMAPSYTSPFKLILKQNGKYLFQIVNTSNQPVTLTWFLFWMEE
jgi:hypothetical protein